METSSIIVMLNCETLYNKRVLGVSIKLKLRDTQALQKVFSSSHAYI